MAGDDPNTRITPATGAFGDMARFVARPTVDSAMTSPTIDIETDPLTTTAELESNSAVAPARDTPTVSASVERKLTAVLIADERRVAVIDDAAVAIGTVLRDGSRVAAIQPNGVWLVDRNGRWRMLTLSRSGGR